MLTMKQTGWEMVGAVAAYFAELKFITIGTSNRETLPACGTDRGKR